MANSLVGAASSLLLSCAVLLGEAAAQDRRLALIIDCYQAPLAGKYIVDPESRNPLDIIIYGTRGRVVHRRQHLVQDCQAHRYEEGRPQVAQYDFKFTAPETEKLSRLEIRATGPDAAFIDNIWLIETDNPRRGGRNVMFPLHKFGVEDWGGWCLSTDRTIPPSWKKWVKRCEASRIERLSVSLKRN